MKYIIRVVLLLTFFIGNSQIGSIETKKGKIVYMYSAIDKKSNKVQSGIFFGNGKIYFYDVKGKRDDFPQYKISKLYLGNKKYLMLPTYLFNVGGDGIHEIIAENDKYILTSYFKTFFNFYIFDKTTMKAVEKKEKYSIKRKKDLKSFNIILEYFSDCEELVSQIKKNINNFDYKYGRFDEDGNKSATIFDGISNYKCKN